MAKPKLEDGAVFPVMQLNDKGQCPECRRKPLTYKRPRLFYFCTRCSREYDAAGMQMSNYVWTVDGDRAVDAPGKLSRQLRS